MVIMALILIIRIIQPMKWWDDILYTSCVIGTHFCILNIVNNI